MTSQESSSATASRVQVQCIECEARTHTKPAKTGALKTPIRWRKVAEDQFRCPKCQAKSYMGRSLRLSILGPGGEETRDKKEMYSALVAASGQSNRFANWLVQRLVAADELQLASVRARLAITGESPEKVKIPPTPKVDYYREARTLFPEIDPSGMCQLAQMVIRAYSSERVQCLLAMNRSVRSYRWDDLPVVVPQSRWRLLADEDGKLLVRIKIGPGKSWTLAASAEAQHLRWLRGVLTGDVIPGMAMFVRRARPPRPGETQRVRVWYLRISCQVPRPTKRSLDQPEKLSLRHEADMLLTGRIAGRDDDDSLFQFPALDLRKLIVAHRQRDYLRQIDASHRRFHWSKRKAQRWNNDRTEACRKQAAKVRNELALVAKALAHWCVRRRVGRVEYDVTPKGFCDPFPYHMLIDRIRTTLENEGIELHIHGNLT
jgi:hypothetical protein